MDLIDLSNPMAAVAHGNLGEAPVLVEAAPVLPVAAVGWHGISALNIEGLVLRTWRFLYFLLLK